MTPLLLVINAGSSSLKFQVFEQDSPRTIAKVMGGQISGVGTERPHFKVTDDQQIQRVNRALDPAQVPDPASAQAILLSWLDEQLPAKPVAVGHRIVHGGPDFSGSVVLTDDIIAQLEALVPLAPLHQPHNLSPVRGIARQWPGVPQVACFDTAFHRHHSPVFERFALPERFYDQGVRRYGFHGLSYHYIADTLKRYYPDHALGRVVVAHLGSGASACGLLNGVSIESTMGFTALDGLPMGTRPGRLDAGVVLWFLEQGLSHDEIQRILYKESGLKGISGLSGDVRDLLQSDLPQARLALDYFAYRTAESIAGLCVALKGIDTLVFTAGIGENCPEVRAAVCEHLAWMGIQLDSGQNARNASVVSAPESAATVLVIPTNEELVIAVETIKKIHTGS
ncbi:MAG: acetate/propionate family kinase [Alcaligenaceae bacterium]|jgi:acetate kinase|nr:acetate/propionate family kinase [Alcaligenaceae bacterium]